jgi:hypothetical protein
MLETFKLFCRVACSFRVPSIAELLMFEYTYTFLERVKKDVLCFWVFCYRITFYAILHPSFYLFLYCICIYNFNHTVLNHGFYSDKTNKECVTISNKFCYWYAEVLQSMETWIFFSNFLVVISLLLIINNRDITQYWDRYVSEFLKITPYANILIKVSSFKDVLVFYTVPTFWSSCLI